MASAFGQRLQTLRKGRGLSQRALADRLKLSHGTIGMYESGLREPDHDTLKKLADFFMTTLDYLLGQTDDPTPGGAVKVALDRINDVQTLVNKLQAESEDLWDELHDPALSDEQRQVRVQRLQEVKHDLANARGELQAAQYDLSVAQSETVQPLEDLVYFLRGRHLTSDDVEAVKDLLEARRLRRERADRKASQLPTEEK